METRLIGTEQQVRQMATSVERASQEEINATIKLIQEKRHGKGGLSEKTLAGQYQQ